MGSTKFFLPKSLPALQTKGKGVFEQADAIISLTNAAREELLSKHAYKQLAIDVIPCCADLQHFSIIIM